MYVYTHIYRWICMGRNERAYSLTCTATRACHEICQTRLTRILTPYAYVGDAQAHGCAYIHVHTDRHDWFYYTSTKCAIPDDMNTHTRSEQRLIWILSTHTLCKPFAHHYCVHMRWCSQHRVSPSLCHTSAYTSNICISLSHTSNSFIFQQRIYHMHVLSVHTCIPSEYAHIQYTYFPGTHTDKRTWYIRTNTSSTYAQTFFIHIHMYMCTNARWTYALTYSQTWQSKLARVCCMPRKLLKHTLSKLLKHTLSKLLTTKHSASAACS